MGVYFAELAWYAKESFVIVLNLAGCIVLPQAAFAVSKALTRWRHRQ